MKCTTAFLASLDIGTVIRTSERREVRKVTDRKWETFGKFTKDGEWETLNYFLSNSELAGVGDLPDPQPIQEAPEHE